VPESPIGLQIHQTLNVHANDAAELSLHIVIFLNVITNLSDFVLTELVGLSIEVYAGSRQYFSRATTPYSENISETNLNSFISGKIYARNSSHVNPAFACDGDQYSQRGQCHPAETLCIYYRFSLQKP
jgi:hypothetical protein